MMYSEEQINQMLGLTSEQLERKCEQLENEQISFEGCKVYDGSILNYVGERRETFIIPNEDFQKIKLATAKLGITKSELYRRAIKNYLADIA